MKKTIILGFVMIIIFAGMVKAQNPETFEQAKILSAEQGKPLLLEFIQEK